MKKFAIFGDPVEHSKSPKMHNGTFKALGVDAIYYKIHLKDGTKLKETFLKEELSGANITVPHKEVAYSICDELDEFAKSVKSVNTIVYKDNKLYGYNTDAPGFLKSINKFNNIKNILILGAGGTTKSSAYFLRDNGFNVEILNRSQPRLENFLRDGFKCYTFDNFNPKEYDLVVNMTSAGLNDNNLPAPKEILDAILPNAKAAVDIIYGKETPFLKLAKEYNLPTQDGSEMLLQQGVLAFDYFTNHQFDLEQIENAMRKALFEE